MASKAITLLFLAGWLLGLALGRTAIYWMTPRYGSIAGGTTVSIYGANFNNDSYTSYSVVLLGQVPCLVKTYTISPDRIECVTEPYPGAVQGRSYPALQASLLTNSVLTTSTSGSSRFNYHWGYTPYIRSVLPKSGPPQSQVAVGGSRLTGNYDRYELVQLGRGVCELRNSTTDLHYGQAYYHSIFHIRCHPTEERAGAVNASLVLTHDRGRTWPHSESLYPMHDWSLGMYEIYPDIHSINPSMGSIQGGCLVTITGTGFTVDSLTDLTVDINGIPCRVISSTPTEIRCWAGTPDTDSEAIADQNMAYPQTVEGFRFRGSRGVKYRQYDGISGHLISHLHSSSKYPDQPDRLSVYPAFGTTPLNLWRHDRYGARLEAFFNPRSSGLHTFYLTHDDFAEAWFTAGKNISRAASIISGVSNTGFNNFYRFSEQRSAGLELDESEDYLLAAEYKEDYGQDYLQVGVHMHNNSAFSYGQTTQVVRETQRVELSSAGLPEVQVIQVTVDLAVVGAADQPSIVVEWDGRRTPPLSVQELSNINASLLELFHGVCEDSFGPELGFFHFNDVYQFEGNAANSQAWTAWQGAPPFITSQDSFCGRYSLYVPDSRALAPYPTTDDSVRVSDNPYLCLAYKLPRGHSMALAVQVRGVGWRSIPLSANPTSPFTALPAFSTYSDEGVVMDDDRWHFACTDLETMLRDHVSLPEDPDAAAGTVPSHIIERLGLYSEVDSLGRGFYVDELSFSSEKRQFDTSQYQPPARPNGVPIHSVDVTMEQVNSSSLTNFTYSLTFVPATCEASLPLLEASLSDGTLSNSGVTVSVSRSQTVSEPVRGHYSLVVEGRSTTPLSFHATPLEVQSALESVEGIGSVTVDQLRQLPHDTLGQLCPGRSYRVRFEDIGRDLPLMEVRNLNLTGEQVQLSARETAAGGLFLRPIPGHMLQTAETTPQLHVCVQGQLAACSGGHPVYQNVPASEFRDYCSFKYGPAATPEVTSVTPPTASAGATITIAGTGFSDVPDENYILFDSVECEVTSSSGTSLTCTLGQSFAGSKLLHLHVLYAGVAHTNGMAIDYLVTLGGVDPAMGSSEGGTELTISGTGFYYANAEQREVSSPPFLSAGGGNTGMGGPPFTVPEPSCIGGWRNEVMLGGNPCLVISSTNTSVTVLTPAEPSIVTARDIQVTVVCESDPNRSSMTAMLPSVFTYDNTLTPSVTMVTQTSGSIVGGETVTITGTGFSSDATQNRILFGEEECEVTSASMTELMCTSPAHMAGSVAVHVTVMRKGRATSSIMYMYTGPTISTISHCTGSLFGGQPLTLGGSGFGTDTESVSVTVGGRPCSVNTVVDTSITCLTPPVSRTHHVNNNAMNTDYALGYSWSPAHITVLVGDTVEWSWTGTEFTTRRSVVQVAGPEATVYDGSGFRSDASITGVFRHTFSTAGIYYYISDGHAHIGFRGTVTVQELGDVSASLTVGFGAASVPLQLSAMPITCSDTGNTFLNYTYSATATPILRSVGQTRVVPGGMITLELDGISSSQDDNLFAFGNSNLGCSSSTPALLPSTVTSPSLAPNTGTYGSYTIHCTVPASLSPGIYRPLLHVAGRGWGHASVEDTTLYVHPRLASSPSVAGGSVHGGLRLEVQTEGLSRSHVGRARVSIGNTPCNVEDIDNTGRLTCRTGQVIDDGYSSLVDRQQPLAYWPLQADYLSSLNGMVVSTDLLSFRSFGSLSRRADATVQGTIVSRQVGISGNDRTDQSILFSWSAFLEVPALDEFESPGGFSLEFWIKVPNFSSHYRVVVNRSSMCNGSPCGFLILLNPCNDLEFWVGGDSSAYASLMDCPRIQDLSSQCGSACVGVHSATMPEALSGSWQVLRSVGANLSDWTHVYVGWQANDVDPGADAVLSGDLVLGANGEFFSMENATYLPAVGSPMELGGSSSLQLGSTSLRDGLAPFTGYLDEVAYYGHLLEPDVIRTHVTYGSSDLQPVWVSVEGVNGVGDGSPPNVLFPPPVMEAQEIMVNWEAARNQMQSYNTSVILVFQWTGVHGIRQVSQEVFASCDLESDSYVRQWSPNASGGTVSIPLDMGTVYYFIDSVAGGCRDGRKIQVQSGRVHVIDWRVGFHDDITIPEGVGLAFRWSGSPHNVLEMTAPIDPECTLVNDNAVELGQVHRGWQSAPVLSGEVMVTGLSVGEHHFACSVADHCQRGMRFTVTVESPSNSLQTSQQTVARGVVHRVEWLIREYQDLTVTEGDAIEFSWGGYHSLHQVREDVYRSCDEGAEPLHVWRDGSVDQTISIEQLTPGSYYFLCSIAGHCSAGMKIKVIVVPREGAASVARAVHADCADSANCSFAYSSDPSFTPRIFSVTPSEVQVGSILSVTGLGLIPSGNNVQVWLGPSLCVITGIMPGASSNETDTLQCTIQNYESNQYSVNVHVPGKGWSWPLDSSLSASLNVRVVASVTSIMPQVGSVLGGNELTLTGSGFSHILSRNTIQLAGITCQVTSATPTELRCIAGPLTTPTNDNVNASIHISVNGMTARVEGGAQYTYSSGATPTITSLSTTEVMGDDVIVIYGTMFIDEVIVNIASVSAGVGAMGDECVIIGNVTDTAITCRAPFLPAGRYQVVVTVDELGVARASPSNAASLTYSLELDEFSPVEAGYGGGVLLTIRGMGFPDRNISVDGGDQVRVTLCDVSCVVLTSTYTELMCRLGPNLDTSLASRACTITVESGSVSDITNSTFSFLSSLTPTITSITPSLGGTAGGTLVVLSGTGFLPPGVISPASLTSNDVGVMIDGAVCSLMGLVTDTSLSCRTGSHRTTLQATVTVVVRGKGTATPAPPEGVVFEYIDLWSSPFTWGGRDPPGQGDSAYIRPGQTVYLDMSPPVLNLVLVEGALVFYDQQDLHLQAKYIFINNGTFQVGTEESPFMHRATITLHGNISDPEIPIYGAKVLGVRQGRLDLHGRPRHVTWTRLAATAQANSSSLVLQQPVDWVPGDRLVLAPTGKDGNETEEVEVMSVSMDGRTIELTRPINYTHHGVTEIVEDGQSIEIRAEVGLLSHNVVVQGSQLSDPQGTLGPNADQYGAQIFIHRRGPNVAPVRIEHVEVRHSGQAFRLGRYSIHFHLTGQMNGSYVRHCSVHHSFNRAITAHGVHQLLIEGNVAYDIMGHTYFVEDGIETENRYLYNLGVLTRGSSSLLNTDQIPATFWITNPQNTFIGNAAAASRAYGFWYDLDNRPSGASFTRSVCPNKAPFGEFYNNTAHSCNEFGLRIWEQYTPYVDGCRATEMGVATLRDFTGYGNGIHGVELSVVGHVRLADFKIADNVENGIEIQETHGDWGGPMIMDSLIIAHTSVNTGRAQTGGVKTPNTPRLTLSNVTFANFDSSSTSCLRACSHCKPRQGGFRVRFQQINFLGGSEQHKAAFKWEFEVLYVDLDGSLTGIPGGVVLPDSPLVPPEHCSRSVPAFSGNSSSHDGTICDASTYFLRVAWNEAEPLVTLRGVGVNVTNEFGMTTVPWRHYRLTHMDGYMMTVPQGYRYEVVWNLPTSANVDTSSYSAGVYGVQPNSTLWITHSFVMLPDHVNVGGNIAGTNHGEDPLPRDENFSWSINNQTSVVTYLISGANRTGTDNNITYNYQYEPCPPQGCPPPAIDFGPYEARQRRWSEPDSWPEGRLPVEGEDVTISSRWRMLVDITPPPLASVYVFGELMFEDSQDYNFTANLILIQGPNSRMIAGTERSPFTHQLRLTLTGRRSDTPLVLARRLILGSKAIGVFGNLSIHGVRRSSTWSRLTASVMAGQRVLQLPQAHVADWRAGDEVVIAPSGYDPSESEVRTIDSISQGMVTLTEPLQYDHVVRPFLEPSDLSAAEPPSTVSGTPPWWGDGGSLAPEVGLLTRNIVIQGGEESDEPLEMYHYGCRILVSQYTSRGYTYTGNLWMDSVEVRYCGQGGYFSPRDPRYSIAFRDNSALSAGNYVRRCSIHHGYNTAVGIHTSNGVEVSRNVIWRTTDSSVKVGGNQNEVRDNLAMMTTTVQPNTPPDSHAVDFPATFEVDGGNLVRGNAAAGSTRLAFEYGGESCLEDGSNPTGDEAQFWDNTAHSGLIGLTVLGLPEPCTAVGGFSSMFQWNYAVFSSTASSLTVSHLRVGIGKVGLNLNVFGPNPVAHLLGNKSITVADSLIVGSVPGESCSTRTPNFWVRGGVSFVVGDHKLGIMMSSFNEKRSKMDGTGAWHLMKGYPVIDGVTIARQVSFARFTSNHGCNYGIYAVGNNPQSPDAVHPLHMTGTNKYNVDIQALAYLYEPDPEWRVQEDCIDMDCDGPKHALVRDIDGRFTSTPHGEGSIVPFAELRFMEYQNRLPSTWLAAEGPRNNMVLATPEQVLEHRGIARGLQQNSTMGPISGGCVYMPSWLGYRCAGLQHHMLVLESLDGDSETRRLSPLALDGGDAGDGNYTDLLNGPMDHGWCTYYTCLKRLSTFFSVVAAQSEYCVWMTGSPPTNIRFLLLNAGPDDYIRLCMWFKTTQRKDVYKNGVFIEAKNVQHQAGGGVVQTDGEYIPVITDVGGANYFDRESQIMHLLVKGSDPVEIRTAPVVQVSMSIAVSVDEFFSVGRLIENIAFVLNINPNRIRVVKIVEEGVSNRFRRSLMQASSSALNSTTTNVTLEFGNPPTPNISMATPPTVEQEIVMSGENNDSVDIMENAVPETPLNGTNPLNEDPPSSSADFVEQFNSEAVQFIEQASGYQVTVQEVVAANELGEQLVNMVLTGEVENATNITVTSLSVVPATPPPPPQTPVIPPEYTEVMSDPTLVVVEEPVVPTLAVNESDDGVINFVFPAAMDVTKEPQEQVGHLVHVQVTVTDGDGQPVHNLGLVTPWMCQAYLSLEHGTVDGISPQLGGVTSVPFVMGVADFTRLRVDRPAERLTLSFHSVPPRFQARTSVTFRVVAPPSDTPREKVGFVLQGDIDSFPPYQSVVVEDIRDGLAAVLDVDVSRIKDISYRVSPSGVMVEFTVLDRQATDPPDVPSLTQATNSLQTRISSGSLQISIGSRNYTVEDDSFLFVTPSLPPEVPRFKLPVYLIIVISVVSAVGLCLLLIVMVICYKCAGKYKDRKGTRVKVAPCKPSLPVPAPIPPSGPQRGHDCWSLPSESSFSDASWASLMSDSTPSTPTPGHHGQHRVVHTRVQPPHKAARGARARDREPHSHTEQSHSHSRKHLGDSGRRLSNSNIHPTVAANFHSHGQEPHPNRKPHPKNVVQPTRISIAHLSKSPQHEMQQFPRKGRATNPGPITDKHRQANVRRS